MKDVRVEYHNEVTINLGNFENQKPGYAMSAVLEGSATKPELEEARVKLKSLVDSWIESDVEEIRAELASA